ncbi:uncharacterized protein LOC112013045 [Quercus suber]|uniref:uncharacterized protein LOC112013045 n=1 Tax=Quercus suber TaxID=58331 RepID=UPI000CE26B25|nr:uncharacterized protein LOC112013045 [Quercus suber]
METRVGGDKAKAIIDRLPFDRSVKTDTIGYTGDLWMLWDSNRVDVTLLADTEQEIHATVKAAIRWNGSHFGNIFTRKKNIMARINGIQWALSIRPSLFLVNLEDELLNELNRVLNQEEELWALKSSVNWMIQGDRNTNFYHVSTLVRRKRNQILAIKDAMGEWVQEDSAVKEIIRSGFNSIYTSSFVSSSWAVPNISQWQASLTNEERESIGGTASEEEIKSALWSLKAFKAPGPDGLHAGFF